VLGIKRSTVPGMNPDKVPCVQCDRREYGLAWGDFCSLCREERLKRAEYLSKRIAIVGAVAMAAWHLWRTPPDFTQRIFAAASVLLVYVIARRLVSLLMMEYLPRERLSRSVEAGNGGPNGEST
jgi:hypothetical protein